MFRDLAVFQKTRTGMLPLDLDPTAQDARIGDDAKQAAPPCGRRRAAILVAHLGLERWRRRRKATAEAWGRLRAQLRLLGCTGSSATAARSPRTRDGDGELLAASLCKKRRGRERAVAVVHGRGLGEERREREWQHGHDLVVVHLGQWRSSQRLRGGSGSAAASPPSWRCTGEGGVGGEAVAGWVVECGSGAA